MTLLLRGLVRDRFLHLLLFIGAILLLIAPFRTSALQAAIDWRTIATLAGLMLLTKGVELSGCFDALGRRMVQRFHSERQLALFLVCAAALLSTFLTNDVALFIVVPLTITLKKLCAIPVSRLIIFEALAVNAGSLLTPIGNPQNILLWGRSGLTFMDFTLQMLPLAAAMLVSLLVLCRFCFPGEPLAYRMSEQTQRWRRGLIISCAVLYIVFLVALEQQHYYIGLVLVAVGFLLSAPRVLVHIDWSLLLVFIVMFIDVHLLVSLPMLGPLLAALTSASQPALFASAIGMSQVISNVPATILLLNILPASTLLAWAANIGGFGLLTGSLANLIALRMAGDRRIWWRFHLYSLPMLAWAALVGYGLWLLR